MTELDIDKITFTAFGYSADEWVKWSDGGTERYGKVSDRTKQTFDTVGDTENVYEVSEYDSADEEFSEKLTELSESSIESWSGPQNSSGIEGDFSDVQMDKEKVFSMWEEMTNMSESEMEMWDDHPCSNVGVDDGENTRDETLMLMGQAPDGWNEESYMVASKHVNHMAEAQEKEPDDPPNGGKGTCPSRWAVNLLNRGMNPFDSFPGGNPQFDRGEPTPLNDAEISFAASAISPQHREIATEFNEHGIRKNYDEEDNLVSVDAVYEAMEPGAPSERNGVRITSDFLKKVAQKDYSNKPPYLMDHSKKTLSQIGFVKDVWYSDSQEKLMVMARAYNTGSQTHDEIVKRLTNDPPTITDGSLGLTDSYEATVNENGEKEILDGKIREFSTTPFPGGYDNGGLKTQYNEEESSETVFIIEAS